MPALNRRLKMENEARRHLSNPCKQREAGFNALYWRIALFTDW
jgi:hypothetical protein